MKRRTFCQQSALTAGSLFLPAPWVFQAAAGPEEIPRIREELRHLSGGTDSCPAHHFHELCREQPFSSAECSISVEVEHLDEEVPATSLLEQNYPNPFNLSTNIVFTLATDSVVDLRVYNMRGQKVAVLVADRLPAGTHRVVWEAQGLAVGTYQYVLKTDAFLQARLMVHLK